ncbi:MAG: hypothetical protein QM719_11230 [Thermomonas sp.]
MTQPHDPQRPAPWYRQLPAKAAAVVVFLVGLTTLAGNLLELRQKQRDAAEQTPVAAPPQTPAVPTQAPQDATATLDVERIVVEHDGSPGTTDWRFAVLADGEPLFAFAQDDLDDGDGRNVAVPREARGVLHFRAGNEVRIEVRGWRESRLRLVAGAPDATGEGVVGPGSATQAVRVAAKDPAAGAFVFHFGLERR